MLLNMMLKGDRFHGGTNDFKLDAHALLQTVISTSDRVQVAKTLTPTETLRTLFGVFPKRFQHWQWTSLMEMDSKVVNDRFWKTKTEPRLSAENQRKKA